ncbi:MULTISPECIES: UvrD-helicase domain-containing protein [Xanthomonas]|uniref:UvrD-helicase domain-containing protein n=1 Tax=Xanthomonas TaxID=338 RepID=UPI0004A3461E|nr:MULTISPECIES: UvrD-helicase domain-containing protein [Xanthomonas]KHS05999.1 helicase UvrD [Xanthomonas phaseoli pv. phaseoli]QTK46699.1 UvrD-helicase domain-containing protein [Xanthomonas euvesicatoria pv. alfalfae]
MPPEIDLLSIQRGSITAPAGCGKTELITRSLAGKPLGKPVLILTHTNAGVAALRARLKKANIPSAAYRLSTIDGFAMRLIDKFPTRSGHPANLLELNNTASDYPAIRQAALTLLTAGHLLQAVTATYDRLWVDEYQDCNTVQHALVRALASMLPTCVLGDPMQAIFGFGDNRLVNWQTDVHESFPSSGALGTPWRWRNAGTEALGQWLLQARAALEAGQVIDLRTAPSQLTWVRLTAGNEAVERRTAARTNAPGQGTVLVIGDSRNVRGRHDLTSQTPGAVVVERVDLPELTAFARRFDLQNATALEDLVRFSAEMMTGVGATTLLGRVESLRANRARNPPTMPEGAAVAFESDRSWKRALELLNALANHPDTRVYRPELIHCCRSAMESAARGEKAFLAATQQARERNRHARSPMARRAVGSTLLLKGLEADVAVLLEPETMTAQHLYVALTRGAKNVVVCSSVPVLTPCP